MADFPTYLKDPESEVTGEENYQEELNQTLVENFGANGLIIPSITNDDLTVTAILDPNSLASTTVADYMPDGTMWFVLDASPPAYVGKISGALVKFTVSSYP